MKNITLHEAMNRAHFVV